METKNCSTCNKAQPPDMFYLQSSGRPFNKCKECFCKSGKAYKKANKQTIDKYKRNWNKSVNGYRHLMWEGIVRRCGTGNYKFIEVRMTKEEWYEFATPMITEFLENNPGDTPSVDRINPKGHYSLDNVRIVSWEKNLTTSNWFLAKLRVNQYSQHSEKIAAIRSILLGQCEALGLQIDDVLKELK